MQHVYLKSEQNRSILISGFRPSVSTVHKQFKPLPSVFNLLHSQVRAYVQSTLLLPNMLIKGNIINAVSQQCRPLLPNWVKHTSTHCRSANRHANRQTHPCAHIIVNSYRDRRMTCVCRHGKVYLCISGRDLHTVRKRRSDKTCTSHMCTSYLNNPTNHKHTLCGWCKDKFDSMWRCVFILKLTVHRETLQDCGCIGVRDLMCL